MTVEFLNLTLFHMYPKHEFFFLPIPSHYFILFIFSDNEEPYERVVHSRREEPLGNLFQIARILIDDFQESKVQGAGINVELPVDYLTTNTPAAQRFRLKICAFNSASSFASMAVNLDRTLVNAEDGVYTFRINGVVHHRVQISGTAIRLVGRQYNTPATVEVAVIMPDNQNLNGQVVRDVLTVRRNGELGWSMEVPLYVVCPGDRAAAAAVVVVVNGDEEDEGGDEAQETDGRNDPESLGAHVRSHNRVTVREFYAFLVQVCEDHPYQNHYKN
ncbi:hypothetical protein BDA99DRAFT_535800 [Phascolomyces articulosus]|uniref:Uncharacterized protein n=1 Tax=Phascolomyces articulosus TaxID=60185 RepID=A0AAD5K417_9FUNG|nr:hypothetical protein BDA99DRAFT_535800 [Phascolomyces articulosus]